MTGQYNKRTKDDHVVEEVLEISGYKNVILWWVMQ